MPTYALIQHATGILQRHAEFDGEPPELPNEKGLAWVPLADLSPPAFDPLREGLRPMPARFDGVSAVMQWEVYPLPDEEVAQNIADEAAQARARAKVRRDEAVQAIRVTTVAGNTFDGDETSQNRMARAVIALQATGTPTVPWTLADNTVIAASAAELTEALALAGAAQVALWALE